MNKNKFSVNKLTSRINVMDTRWKYYILIPTVIFLIGIIAFMSFSLANGTAVQGMNVGLDFTGGSALSVEVGKDLTAEEFNSWAAKYTEIIEAKDFDVNEPQKTGSGTETKIYIKYSNPTKDKELEELNGQIKEEVLLASSELGITEANITVELKTASAAKKLLIDAIIAIAVTWVLVLIYVVIRFELFSGIAAVIALAFDVIGMVSLTVLFHIPVNTTFVAALITIVSYSINNTIVVFDRVRDHVKGKGIELTTANIGFEVNSAVQETAVRTVASTFTTMLTVLILTIIGVPAVREFCLPIIFGLIVGMFDSLLVAPSLYIAMRTSYLKSKQQKAGYVGATSKDGTAPAAPAKKKHQVKANVTYKYRRK